MLAFLQTPRAGYAAPLALGFNLGACDNPTKYSRLSLDVIAAAEETLSSTNFSRRCCRQCKGGMIATSQIAKVKM